MKNIFKYIVPGVALLLAAGGCSNFEEMNTDPDTTTKVSPALLCTSALTTMAKFSGDAKAYIATAALPKYVAYAQEGQMAEQYNNIGRGSFTPYAVFPNLDDMVSFASKSGAYEVAPYRGVEHFVKAYILYRLTMEMGDIPCSQAGKGMSEGIMKVRYDPQEQVFATVLAYLQTAAENFSQSSANFPGDIFFGGDPSKWLKATNALRLKVLMSLSAKADNTTLNVKTAFAGIVRDGHLMESNADNLALTYVDKPNSYHPLYSTNDKFVVNTMMSSFVVDKLKALNDYRLFYYAAPYENAAGDGYAADQMEAYRGVDVTLDFTGINTAYNSRDYSLLNKRYVQQKASEPLVLVGYAEQCLLIAEAIERGWVSGTSQTYYENGVKAALAFVMGLDASTVGKAVTQAYIDGYFSGEAAYKSSSADRLRQIWDQKYLMTFLQDCDNAYFEYRRTGWPQLPVDPSTSLNVNAPDKLPVRWMYPSTEETTNKNNLLEALNRQFGNEADEINALMWVLK